MNLQVIKNAVTSKAARQLLHIQKNSPTLLFAAGVVGVGAGVFLACRATLKLEDILEESDKEATKIRAAGAARYDYSDQDVFRDLAVIKVKTAVDICKVYTPAVLVLSSSIAAITGSHVILTRRNAGLMAAYSALDKGFKEYRDRVKAELGDEKDEEFRHGVDIFESKDGVQVKLPKPSSPKDIPSIYARFFDEGSTSWRRHPEYNSVFLNAQQNFANDLLLARGHVFLNEIYDMLGLPRSKAGAVVGWVLNGDGDNFIDFGMHDGKDARKRRFINQDEYSVLLDFNVDGIIYDQI